MTEWSQPDQAERFVREYADPILRVCAAYSLGRSDAQDICQDIFLTLLEETRTFDTPDHERAFILRCAINACKDILKSSRFRRTAPLEEAERVAAPAPGEEHQVWQAVADLPAKERILVYLFYCEGYSLEEAAQMCGCSYAAARQRLLDLDDEAYADLLSRMAAKSAKTGREEIILNDRDRRRVGDKVVAKANALLAQANAPELPRELKSSKAGSLLNKVVAAGSAILQGTALLTLSQETREMDGGLILREGNVEINCAFETQLRLLRGSMAAEVAGILFPQ